MPGRTGKRASQKRPCGRCGKPIPPGDFYRTKEADYDPACFEAKMAEESKGGGK